MADSKQIKAELEKCIADRRRMDEALRKLQEQSRLIAKDILICDGMIAAYQKVLGEDNADN